MAKTVITGAIQDDLKNFFQKNRKADLITTYLYYLEKKHNLSPVLFLKEKTIYQSQAEILQRLEKQGKIWRETEIKIQFGQPSVNANTKKIYICPFTGKVYGDNTHPNPQDAIYDWVSKCPENTERIGGLKVKRFYVSEDLEVIKNYIQTQKKSITKTVYSSAVTGKLFNTKEAVIQDFKKNQLKPLSLTEVPSQNRFHIEESFMNFIQEHLEESRITSFVESMGQIEEFSSHVGKWLE